MNDIVISKNTNVYVVGLVLLMTILSLLIKIMYLDYVSGDYVTFLSNWISFIRYNDGFVSLAKQYFNYTPLYVYFLAFISYFDFNHLYALKIFSIFFEYLAAFFIGKIILSISSNKNLFWLSFGIVPFIPSIILNSSFMAQCDAIYVSMLLGSVYFLMKKNNIVAMIFLGLAFSLKFQAAFILPFYFVYLLRGNIKWYMFTIIPLVYVITILPVWLVGGNFLSLLTVYSAQSAYSYELSSFFPNIYYLGLSNVLGTNKIPGLVFMVLLVLISGWLLKSKKLHFTPTLWIHLLFLSAIVCPYFLPGMRERYLYFGDLTVVLYVMLYWRNPVAWFVALGIWFVSFYAYALSLEYVAFYDLSGFDHSFFRSFKVIKWKVICLLYLAIIAYVLYDFIRKLVNSKQIKSFE